MSHYHIDERDILFNIKECPGLAPILDFDAFSELDADTFDMIFEQSKAFCLEKLAPVCKEGDQFGCRLENGEVVLSEAMDGLWDAYRELDLIGMNSSSEFGGAELPHFFTIPLTELESGSFVSFSMLPLLTRGAARLIQNFGSEHLKHYYLPRMFSGGWSGTMCLTEPGAGSDVGSGITKAVPEGDHYKITGTKIFITWGDHPYTDNIIHLVLARIPGSPSGSKGLSLFVVPKNRTNAEGRVTGPNDVVCGNLEKKMGIKASPTCVINFGTDDGCIGYLLGEPCRGLQYMFQMMNEARIEVGVQGLAQASAAYLSSCHYASERIQGRVTLADGTSRAAKLTDHEDVQRMLLKMRALSQGIRALVYNLVFYLDCAEHHPTEGDKYKALVELMTPICKSYGSDQGFRVTEMAVQTYGGYGYCQEYPVEQYMRDCKISSIYEGTNGIQALDLVFRKILKNRGAYLQVWAEEAAALCQAVKGSELEDLGVALTEASQQTLQTAGTFGEWFMAGRADRIRFSATDFQEHFGHVLVAYFLLKQAHYAQGVLADTPADAAFYKQKMVTARYFYSHILRQAVNGMQVLQEAELPAYETAFP